ncbi:MAG TPA: M23 family metallopeptidase, partial [Oligoflexia bacterium]|nr:M23 family metallopeptidase [Oligoflexia bacterium]
VDHGDGIETVYAHLSRITVKSGQRICRSQQIGLVGASGRATGPHLHYEVLINGEPHNPERFVQLARFLRFVNI